MNNPKWLELILLSIWISFPIAGELQSLPVTFNCRFLSMASLALSRCYYGLLQSCAGRGGLHREKETLDMTRKPDNN
jgi:hypothetical protein